MKTERNILVAFILNIAFSIFEFAGGLITNSVAILSDSIHDIGDAFSIGVSFFLEKKSKRHADNKYTYGYIRYSVLGSIITTFILIIGSLLVICSAIGRIINPVTINYSGMFIFALFGIILNTIAAVFTKDGDSLNQKAVNLHMLEDVLGWILVFVGSIIMRFTDITIIDPIMSICVALFIFINALKNLKTILDVFLEKTPKDIDIDELKKHLLKIKDVDDIHHIHIWSIDGINNYATMHIVTKAHDIKKVKGEIRKELEEHGIVHAILETEEEVCDDTECHVHLQTEIHHHHH